MRAYRIGTFGDVAGITAAEEPEPEPVDSRVALEAMIGAIEAHRLRPVIGATFPLREAREAYRQFASGGHVGKIVIGG